LTGKTRLQNDLMLMGTLNSTHSLARCLTSLFPLFKGSGVSIKTGRTFTGVWEQLWPDALAATTTTDP